MAKIALWIWILICSCRCHNHPHGDRCTIGEDKEGTTQTVLLGEPEFIIVILRRFVNTGRGMVKNNQSVALGDEVMLNGNEYTAIAGTAHLGHNLQSGMRYFKMVLFISCISIFYSRTFCVICGAGSEVVSYIRYAMKLFCFHAIIRYHISDDSRISEQSVTPDDWHMILYWKP